MTNRLGKNTRNLPVNFLVEEFKIIDRMAFTRSISTGEFIRRKLRLGIAVSDPEAAKELARLRRARLRASAGIALVLVHAFLGGQALRARTFRAWKARQEFDQVS